MPPVVRPDAGARGRPGTAFRPLFGQSGRRAHVERIEPQPEPGAELERAPTTSQGQCLVLSLGVKHPAMAAETPLAPHKALDKGRLAPAYLAQYDHIGARQLPIGVALPRVEAEQAARGLSTDVTPSDAQVLGEHEGVQRAQLNGGGPMGRREPPLTFHLAPGHGPAAISEARADRDL